MTSAIIRKWIFGFLQADTPGLSCTGGDLSPLCPAATIATLVSDAPSSLGCTRWVLAHAPPGRVRLPPQCVGAALLLLTPPALPAASRPVTGNPAPCSHRLWAAWASLTPHPSPPRYTHVGTAATDSFPTASDLHSPPSHCRSLVLFRAGWLLQPRCRPSARRSSVHRTMQGGEERLPTCPCWSSLTGHRGTPPFPRN